MKQENLKSKLAEGSKESKGFITKSIRNNLLTRSKKEAKGITLIALVITIIVLLILAGVAIATLLGDNGIITRATTAKDKTREAGAVERVQVEVAGSYGTDGNIDIDELNDNLKNNISGLTYKGKELTEDTETENKNRIENLPATVTLDGYEIDIYSNGDVSIKVNLTQEKTAGTVFKNNTKVTDSYGNKVAIPAGFKIASDSADDVTGGIVIEDSTYENTKGSQFVWIPVGDVYTDENQTEDKKKTIELKRYVFSNNGDIEKELSKTEPSDPIKPRSTDSAYYTEGVEDDETQNTHAKDIEAFRTSAINNHGYYIGRYEARKNEDEKLTEKGEDEVYNNIIQPEAAQKAENMYTDGNFTSDLMNSYAWDTAIVFEQEFDNRTTDKSKKYSQQTSLNTGSVATTGTNNLEGQQDKICNIWDMASNCYEWTTETCKNTTTNTPCVARGGYSDSTSYVSNRGIKEVSARDIKNTFRPILYL